MFWTAVVDGGRREAWPRLREVEGGVAGRLCVQAFADEGRTGGKEGSGLITLSSCVMEMIAAPHKKSICSTMIVSAALLGRSLSALPSSRLSSVHRLPPVFDARAPGACACACGHVRVLLLRSWVGIGYWSHAATAGAKDTLNAHPPLCRPPYLLAHHTHSNRLLYTLKLLPSEGDGGSVGTKAWLDRHGGAVET